MNAWEKYPSIDHLSGSERTGMERRRRHRQVRYLLFRLQNAETKKEPLLTVDNLPPGFIEFWLAERPRYALNPKGERVNVPAHRNMKVCDLGGYSEFAKKWDVDADLLVYIRHASVWQEWSAILARVVPVMGD